MQKHQKKNYHSSPWSYAKTVSQSSKHIHGGNLGREDKRLAVSTFEAVLGNHSGCCRLNIGSFDDNCLDDDVWCFGIEYHKRKRKDDKASDYCIRCFLERILDGQLHIRYHILSSSSCRSDSWNTRIWPGYTWCWSSLLNTCVRKSCIHLLLLVHVWKGRSWLSIDQNALYDHGNHCSNCRFCPRSGQWINKRRWPSAQMVLLSIPSVQLDLRLYGYF